MVQPISTSLTPNNMKTQTQFVVKHFENQIHYPIPTDLILSSGFLAFARQAGVIAAIEDSKKFTVQRIVGTSSGSLAGSLFASGLSADEISNELSKQRPIKLVSPVINPRGGLFSMRSVINHLRTILPKDFDDLPIPLAVGVIDYKTKEFALIDSGDLPEAVAASCAIPDLFKPVVAGKGANRRLYADGGVSDRTGLNDYSKWTKGVNTNDGNIDRKCMVHLVESTGKYEATCAAEEAKLPASRLLIRTPRANANFFSLKDYERQRLVAYRIAMKAIHHESSDRFLERSRETGYVVEDNQVFIRKRGRLMPL